MICTFKRTTRKAFQKIIWYRVKLSYRLLGFHLFSQRVHLGDCKGKWYVLDWAIWLVSNESNVSPYCEGGNRFGCLNTKVVKWDKNMDGWANESECNVRNLYLKWRNKGEIITNVLGDCVLKNRIYLFVTKNYKKYSIA